MEIVEHEKTQKEKNASKWEKAIDLSGFWVGDYGETHQLVEIMFIEDKWVAVKVFVVQK